MIKIDDSYCVIKDPEDEKNFGLYHTGCMVGGNREPGYISWMSLLPRPDDECYTCYEETPAEVINKAIFICGEKPRW